MPKKSERKYGNYYRKRVPLPDGGYRDVYGKTLAERDEKVEALQRQLAAEKPRCPARDSVVVVLCKKLLIGHKAR